MKYPVRIIPKDTEVEIYINSELQTYIVLCELVEKMAQIEELVYYEEQETETVLKRRKKVKKIKNILIKGKSFDYEEQDVIRAVFPVELKEYIVFLETKEKLGLYAIEEVYSKETEDGGVKFIKTSLRSGRRVEYSGSIVILGDVNSGAEIIAGGNVVVTGVLRGLAHAGASGNVSTFISASGTGRIQIRIANQIEEIEENDKPVIFQVNEGKIEGSNLQ